MNYLHSFIHFNSRRQVPGYEQSVAIKYTNIVKSSLVLSLYQALSRTGRVPAEDTADPLSLTPTVENKDLMITILEKSEKSGVRWLFYSVIQIFVFLFSIAVVDIHRSIESE